MKALALLLLLPACDVVFGLDRDRAPSDAAMDADTAPSTMVTGRFVLHYVSNSATGTPIEIETVHPDVQLSVVTGDGDEGTGVPLDASGAFSFERPAGAAYRLTWTSVLDGNVATELQTALPHLELVSFSAGRPERVPVTLPTPLTFTTPPTVGAHIVLSTGLWSETGISGDAMDWKSAFASTPPLGLLDAAKNDRLVYVVRSPFVDTGTGITYTAFSSDASKAVTLADGAPQNVTLAFVASTRDQCAKIVAPRAAAMQRVALAAGSGTAPGGDDWLVQAAPGSSMGPIGALTLAFHNEVAPTPPTNQIINVAYRNPFPGHTAIATMGAYYGRTITAPSSTGLYLATGVRVFTPVAACPAQTALDANQGIPGAISLAGVQLTGPDGSLVPVDPNAALPVSWSFAAPGRVDLTAVTLLEVTSDAGKTTLRPVQVFKTTEQSVKLPANLLQPGTDYILRLDASIGYPNAATGDLRTVQYPYGNATQWSRVFGISTP